MPASEVTLLIIDSHPVQYRVPIYCILAKLLAKSGSRLHVIYGSDSSVRGALDPGFGQNVSWDEPLLERYSNEFLPGADQSSPGAFNSISGKNISSRIRELRPTAIFLNGINYALFIRALVTARRMAIPVWLRSETQDHAFSRSRIKSLARKCIYRVAYSQISHFFPIGLLNAEHYRAHGVTDRRMTFCRYCVVDRFQGSAAELQLRCKAKREALGIAPDSAVVMFSGKLTKKKNPMALIEGWKSLAVAERASFSLLFVGSGEQEVSLRQAAAECGAPAVFAGFVNQSAIADFYLASDAVILPSRQMGETWGLVANEALLAGKPLILSKNAGSSEDFRDFRGVQVIDPSPETVAEAYRKLNDMPEGDEIRSQMDGHTIEAAADAIFTQIGNFRART